MINYDPELAVGAGDGAGLATASDAVGAGATPESTDGGRDTVGAETGVTGARVVMGVGSSVFGSSRGLNGLLGASVAGVRRVIGTGVNLLVGVGTVATAAPPGLPEPFAASARFSSGLSF